MADFAKSVQTLKWVQPDPEVPGTWENDKLVILTKNSFSSANELETDNTKVQVFTQGGRQLVIDQTIAQILNFLNAV